MREILNENISILKLDKKISEKLIENGIDNVYKLGSKSRLELAELNFQNSEVNAISISLQLQGLDLKRNHAKKNVLLNM